mmetsp:Transcript_34955/g.46944  ORF Transcript_34955/g.46944 Transcript_34955/m.46944 type:complete len:119 (+) Transcript_34955:340-696(+)
MSINGQVQVCYNAMVIFHLYNILVKNVQNKVDIRYFINLAIILVASYPETSSSLNSSCYTRSPHLQITRIICPKSAFHPKLWKLDHHDFKTPIISKSCRWRNAYKLSPHPCTTVALRT